MLSLHCLSLNKYYLLRNIEKKIHFCIVSTSRRWTAYEPITGIFKEKVNFLRMIKYIFNSILADF